MSDTFFQFHLFFCLNERSGDRKCCMGAGALDFFMHAKQRIAALGLKEKIRVNRAGCLGRCQQGPSVVIYPQGCWYRVESVSDVDRIIDEHLLAGEPVKALQMLPRGAKTLSDQGNT